MATDDRDKTVLVPPMGVHTPGRTAMPEDAGAPLVEVPADAEGNPEKVRAAVEAVQRGDFVEGPPGIAHQDSTGLAHDQEGLDAAADADAETRKALGVPEPAEQRRQREAESEPARPAKATKGTSKS